MVNASNDAAHIFKKLRLRSDVPIKLAEQYRRNNHRRQNRKNGDSDNH